MVRIMRISQERTRFLFGHSRHVVLIRSGVMAALVLSLLLVGYISGTRSWRLAATVAAAPLAFVVAVQIVHKISWGIVAILGTAALVPLSLPTGTETEIVASMLLTAVVVALWMGKMLVVGRKVVLKPAPTNWPILGFVGAAGISLVWSNAFRDPLVITWPTYPFVQLASLAVMVLLPGAFLLVANGIEDVRWLKIMVGLVLVTGTLGLAREFSGILVPVDVNVLGLFPMWATTISLALVLYDRNLPLWQRILLLVFAAGWVGYGYFRRVTWLAAWVPSFAGMAVVSVMRSRWFIPVVAVVLILVGFRYLDAHLETEWAESGETRLAAWVQNWEVTGKHLLFGTGPAGYAAYYMSYFPKAAMASHNNYLDILSQTGIVGLFFYTWFFAALVWVGYRVSRRLRHGFDFRAALATAAFAGTLGCVVAMGIGDWVIPFAYTNTVAGFNYIVYNWLFMGAIPVLDFLTRAEGAG